VLAKSFDIFLSHSKVDREWVLSLKRALEAYQVTVWFDEQQLRPGDLWVDGLELGLGQSRSVGLVISPDAVASPWVKEEYHRAIILANRINETGGPGLRLIPLRLRAAPLPGFLEGRQSVDFTDEQQFPFALARLVEGIRQQRECVVSGPLPGTASQQFPTLTPVRQGVETLIDETHQRIQRSRIQLVLVLVASVMGISLVQAHPDWFGTFTSSISLLIGGLCAILAGPVLVENYREHWVYVQARKLHALAPYIPSDDQMFALRALTLGATSHVIR
jgi:TIR domain